MARAPTTMLAPTIIRNAPSLRMWFLLEGSCGAQPCSSRVASWQLGPGDLAVRSAVQVKFWADRHDTVRVDAVMAAVVVLLDVVEADGFRHARPLVKLASVAPQIGVIDQTPDVAFEMAVVNGIEANQGSEEAPIGLCKLVSNQETLPPKALFQTVQAGEHTTNFFFVYDLFGGEASLVNTVVHGVIDLCIDGVYFRQKLCWGVIPLLGANVIKCRVQHTDDLC